jgi:hypothetical protein
LDAIFDVVKIFVVVYGAGEVVVHGWTPHTIAVVVALGITSFFGTALWTHIGRKISPVDPDEKVYGT